MTAASPEARLDPELAALAALDGNDREGALGLLMEHYGRELYRYCRSLVADAELAAEVHQMTFVQAYESLGGFARRSSLRGWLYGIARHRCLDAMKRERRRRGRFEGLEGVEDRADQGPGAERRLAERSLRKSLEGCLRRLAPRVREAVLLRFQHNLSYVEMARLSGEKAPALQIRVARALPVLRRCLEELEAAP